MKLMNNDKTLIENFRISKVINNCLGDYIDTEAEHCNKLLRKSPVSIDIIQLERPNQSVHDQLLGPLIASGEELFSRFTAAVLIQCVEFH